MITLKQESILLKKLKQLSELEMDGLLKELAEHLAKNSMAHLMDNRFRDFQGELDELQEEYNDLEELHDDAKSYAQKAVSILENLENIDDDIQKDIDKTINLLNAIS